MALVRESMDAAKSPQTLCRGSVNYGEAPKCHRWMWTDIERSQRETCSRLPLGLRLIAQLPAALPVSGTSCARNFLDSFRADSRS